MEASESLNKEKESLALEAEISPLCFDEQLPQSTLGYLWLLPHPHSSALSFSRSWSIIGETVDPQFGVANVQDESCIPHNTKS